MERLALCGANASVLRYRDNYRGSISMMLGTAYAHCPRDTHGEEDPLEQLAVMVGVRVPVERELVLLVVVLLEVKQDRCRFENGEVVARAVDEGRDPAVRVQLDEPWLFLRVLAEVNFVDAVESIDRTSMISTSASARDFTRTHTEDRRQL